MSTEKSLKDTGSKFKVGDRVVHLIRDSRPLGTVKDIDLTKDKFDQMVIDWDNGHKSNLYSIEGCIEYSGMIRIAVITPLEELL